MRFEDVLGRSERSELSQMEAAVNGGEKFPRIVGQKFPTSF
jgi:hypothetical protein